MRKPRRSQQPYIPPWQYVRAGARYVVWGTWGTADYQYLTLIVMSGVPTKCKVTRRASAETVTADTCTTAAKGPNPSEIAGRLINSPSIVPSVQKKKIP